MSLFAVTSSVAFQAPQAGQDEFGDDDPTFDPRDAGVGVHITERSRSVYDQASGRMLTIRYHHMLAPSYLHLGKGWRVVNEYTGEKYRVTHVARPQNLVMPGAVLSAEMERIE